MKPNQEGPPSKKAKYEEPILFRSNGTEPIGFFYTEETVKTAKILVIGYNFEKDPKNSRSESLKKDLKNIRKVFGKYKVDICNLIGLKKDDLLQNLEEEILLENMGITGPVDLLILFVLSHGLENGLILTDTELNGKYETFHKNEIWDKLAAVKKFKNALKISFMGPCRGPDDEERFPSGSKIRTDLFTLATEPKVYMDQTAMKNHVVLYSTVENTASLKDENGTWMVQSVCFVLQNMERDLPLEDFLTRVTRQIASVSEDDVKNKKIGQTPEFVMFPHTEFTFCRLDIQFLPLDHLRQIRIHSRSSEDSQEDDGDDYYSWETSKGKYLAPGVAYIFFDDQHKDYVEDFRVCFALLHLDVHVIQVANMTSYLQKVARFLDEEGMVLICCLCKLNETETGELNLCYDVLEEQENISSVTGIFTSKNCPQMNGRAKVFFFLDSGISTDAPDRRNIIVTTTNPGNNHSDSLCLYLKGVGVLQNLSAVLSQKEKHLQEILRELFNSLAIDSKAVMFSTMQQLLEFPQIDPIYMKPKFQIERLGGNREDEMKFDDIVGKALFLRGNNSNEGHSSRDSIHEIDDASSQPKPGRAMESDQPTSDDKCQIVVLSSAPGSGKTKTAKEIAKRLQNQQINSYLFDLRECDEQISESLNLNEFLKKCQIEDIDKKKTAIIFDGVDEIFPLRRDKFLPFFKQASQDFGFVLITTRPQEQEHIEQILKENVLWLSIKEFDQEESKLFMKRLLKGVDDWEQIWQGVSRRLDLPKTPQVLQMLAELLKDKETMEKLSKNEYNVFTIYWHVICLQIYQAKEKHPMPQKWFDIMKYLIQVAVEYLVKGEKYPKVDKEVQDIINKVGLARFDANGTFVFEHKTYSEFLVCLGFLISPGHIPVFTPELKVAVLWKKEFDEVRSFLDTAFEINFKDELFKEEFPSEEMLKALNVEDNAFKVLQQATVNNYYFNFLKFDLEKLNLTEKEKNDLLYTLLLEARFDEKRLNALGKVCDKLVKNGADLFQVFDSFKDSIQEEEVLYKLAGSNCKSIKSLVELIKDDKKLLNLGFLSAVRWGNLENVQMFLSKGADITAQNDWGEFFNHPYVIIYDLMALHVAACFGQKVVFEFLVQQEGMPINLINEWDGRTPLHCVAEGGQLEMFQFVLNKPRINIQETDYEGRNVLHHAAEGGKVQIVEELLKRFDSHKEVDRILMEKLDVNAKDNWGNTPLHLAAQKGKALDVVKILVKNEKVQVNAQNKEGETVLHIATSESIENENFVEIIRLLLLRKDIDLLLRTNQGRTVLHYAAQIRYKEVFQLVEEKLDVTDADNEGNTPLHLAAQKGNLNVVEILVKNEKVQVNAQNKYGETALHFAAKRLSSISVPVVRLLLSRRDINLDLRTNQGQTALHYAAQGGNKEVFQVLEEKLRVNAQDYEGNTALHLAAQKGNKYVVEILVQNKRVQINAQNEKNETALHIAARELSNSWNIEIIHLLLSRKDIDLHLRTHQGQTALHYAAQNNNKEVFQLLEEKLDVNDADNEGNTPLHLAAQKGREDVVKILFKNEKVQVNAKDNEGNTSLHLAAKNGNWNMVQIIFKNEKVQGNAQNKKGETALDLAENKEMYFYTEIIHFISSKKDIDFKLNTNEGKMALHCAVQNGDEMMFQFLMEKLDVNAKDKEGNTPLHLAVQERHVHVVNVVSELIKKLVKNEMVQVNAQNNKGETALHLVACNYSEDIVRLFLARKDTNLHLRTNEGQTVLHYTAGNWDEDVNYEDVFQLLAENLDVNDADNEGNTPLHLAARCENKGVVEILVQNEIVQVNAQNKYGETALHIAASEESDPYFANYYMKILRLLLRRKDIDLQIQTNEGKTALDLSTDPERIKILRAAMELHQA